MATLPAGKVAGMVAGPEVVAIVRVDDDGALVSARGEFDVVTVGHLERALQQACAAARDVVVDLAGVEFLDASVLRAVVDAHSRVAASGCRLRVINANPLVRRVFAAARLDYLLDA
jgi:anti-sigma B factor antagonist